jgi:hypothetical protein
MKGERWKVKEENHQNHPNHLLTAHAALGGESQDYRGNLRSDIWGIAWVSDISFHNLHWMNTIIGKSLRTASPSIS